MTYPVTYGPPPVLAQRSPMPVEPVTYPQMLRTPRATRGRGVLMIVCFVLSYLLVSSVLQGGAIGWDVYRGRTSLDDLMAMRLNLTPALLIAARSSRLRYS